MRVYATKEDYRAFRAGVNEGRTVGMTITSFPLFTKESDKEIEFVMVSKSNLIENYFKEETQ